MIKLVLGFVLGVAVCTMFPQTPGVVLDLINQGAGYVHTNTSQGMSLDDFEVPALSNWKAND